MAFSLIETARHAWQSRAGYRTKIWLSGRSGATPVIVYQMGKVGSTSINTTLARAPELRRRTFTTHYMLPSTIAYLKSEFQKLGLQPKRHLDDGLALHKHIIEPKRPVRIITLVREPIGRDIAAYFQNLDKIWKMNNAHLSVPFDDICAGFKEFESFPAADTLGWFDDEFAKVLGVDVYDHPFSPDDGFASFVDNGYEILVMRTDLADEAKEECISEFLSIERITLTRANDAESKPYADVYRRFKKEVTFPRSYVEHSLESKFARHFFTDAERKNLWQRFESQIQD